MIVFFIVMSIIMGYAFVGGLAGAKHHAIASRRCSPSDPNWCMKSSWCNHVHASLWIAGVCWPVGLPVFAGLLAGGSKATSHSERRRQREIDEANHKVELAKIRAEETAHLEKELGINL